MDLFTRGRQAQIERESPLANRMRPRTLDEFAGQDHIVGPGRLLRRAIQADQLSSLIFYGPPGTGKTTLATVIANSTESHFITINAVLSGVKEIREAIASAKDRRDLYGQRTTLFVDEVHRWNKAQQDALLPHVENGMIILIGATTENPYFEVNKALVSRSRIFQLKPLTSENLRQIARRALQDEERGYGGLEVRVEAEALDHLIDVANGDARGVLNALELAVETTAEDNSGVRLIDLAVAEESIQRRAVLYDKEGDVHYDTISAFIKSLRGSDPDAALYWMAKMVYAGEDARFIFRRMAIVASEDVGLADPHALEVVISCWSSYERIGMPEGRFPLAQAALYLATAPKSNSTLAFFDALAAVEKEADSEVPNHLRDGNRDSEGFGHGKGYLYPHAYRDHWVAQQYLPGALQGKLFYEPTNQGYERQIGEQVARRREAQLAAMVEGLAESPLEVLSTSPANRARDAWLQRAVAGAGGSLARQRDRLFELAAVQRHHLLLDLKAGSGLLTWEALRRAPEGGVWALAPDPAGGDALRQQAARLPELERPVILIGEPGELEFILALRDEENVRFDRVIGRNLFNNNGQQAAELLATIRHNMVNDGLLVLAQTIPRHTQRLAALVQWGDSLELSEKVRAAEERIYADEDDSMVNWNEMDLEKAGQSAGFEVQELIVERRPESRRIAAQQVENWFSPSDRQLDRLSYADHLRNAGLSDEEMVRVRTLLTAQLADKDVQWHTTVAYLLARNA